MIIANPIKPMATPAGQARNAEVFRAAAQLIVRQGYGGTSIGDIAKAVGMTKAGLYHHISSKQDMLFQILQHALNELERVVIAPAELVEDPEQRLRNTISLYTQGIIDYGPAFTLLFPERRHLDTPQRTLIDNRISRFRAYVREALQALADQGKLRELDIDIATRHILQTIVGMARWYPRNAKETATRLIEQTVNFNLSAILRTPDFDSQLGRQS
jgi:TetR/AcrR family transcriptional regulator, cholesterol catabolism regulator